MKYKKLRIIIASVIIAFLCLGCLGTFSYAEDADSDQAFEVLDNPTDYISDDEKQQVLEDGTGLPASFDLRNVDTDGDGIGDRCYVTPVRSQYPFGTCWGFASMSAAETSILSRVLNNDPDAWKTLNLSEKQLIFFANVFLDDPDSSQYGEGRYGVNEEDPRELTPDDIYGGGSAFLAAHTFAAGIGPVMESRDEALEYKGKNGITYVFKKIPNIDGEYVKTLRKKLGLSQAMFAALMKVSNKTVEKWEQGANPVTNGNAIAMVLFNKYPSLVETFIEVKEAIMEPDFSNVNASEEVPQGLKLAKAK